MYTRCRLSANDPPKQLHVLSASLTDGSVGIPGVTTVVKWPRVGIARIPVAISCWWYVRKWSIGELFRHYQNPHKTNFKIKCQQITCGLKYVP